MLSNASFLAKFRFDTAENEPAKNLQNFANFSNFAAQQAGADRARITSPTEAYRPRRAGLKARSVRVCRELAWRKRMRQSTHVVM